MRERLSVLSTDLKDTKKTQIELEMKTTISEMKNTLDWVNSRLYTGEEKISGTEDLVREIMQKERQKKIEKSEQNIIYSVVGQLQAA